MFRELFVTFSRHIEDSALFAYNKVVSVPLTGKSDYSETVAGWFIFNLHEFFTGKELRK